MAIVTLQFLMMLGALNLQILPKPGNLEVWSYLGDARSIYYLGGDVQLGNLAWVEVRRQNAITP
jgi:hypothetical protein